MKVFIVEDEQPAVTRLTKMLLELYPSIQITGQADSIEKAVAYFNNHKDDQLIFMDIHLADGSSFEIFNQTNIEAPVIFTTAYDQYALQAFKVNSIDYLLKPIDETELAKAIQKHEQLHSKKAETPTHQMLKLLKDLNSLSHKDRIMIKRGQQLSFLKIDQIACFFAEGKFAYAVDTHYNKYILDNTLSTLENEVSPRLFFRINRNLIVHIDAISKVHSWAGNRLQVELKGETQVDTVVSRERVTAFKEWLGGNNNH
ncbi:MAG: response regulator transcription factor [Sediminibacterium sp.]|nr:response regulator transcription factor [Sediminibacterium sp.]